jgi:hypothetical protein
MVPPAISQFVKNRCYFRMRLNRGITARVQPSMDGFGHFHARLAHVWPEVKNSSPWCDALSRNRGLLYHPLQEKPGTGEHL